MVVVVELLELNVALDLAGDIMVLLLNKLSVQKKIMGREWIGRGVRFNPSTSESAKAFLRASVSDLSRKFSANHGNYWRSKPFSDPKVGWGLRIHLKIEILLILAEVTLSLPSTSCLYPACLSNSQHPFENWRLQVFLIPDFVKHDSAQVTICHTYKYLASS